MSYDVHIPRCTHIKTNGTQCGSPALRGRRFCFFHKNWQAQRIELNAQPAAPLNFTMPVLEDADSVQVALMQVMRLILAGQLDPKVAGLLLYALQTAALNLRQMKLEPYRHESVVIDPRSVADNGVDDDAWSRDEFEENEEEDDEEDQDEEQDGEAEDSGDEESGEEESGEEENEGEEDGDDEEIGEEENEGEEEDSSPAQPANVAPARPSKKPVRAAQPARTARAKRAGDMTWRQPGADKDAIVVELNENAIARELLKVLDFGPHPEK